MINSILYIAIISFLLLGCLYFSTKNRFAVLYISIIYFWLVTYEWLVGVTLRWNIIIMAVGPGDIYAVYLMLLSLMRINKRREHYPKIIRVSTVLLILLFVVALIRGVFTYGWTTEIQGDIRRFIEGWFVPFVCVLYYPIDIDSKRLKKIINRFTDSIMLFCIICWMLEFIGINVGINTSLSDAGSNMRVLRPEQVVVVSTITLYYLNNDIENRNRISRKTILLIATIVLLQHRTAWATLAAGIIAYIIIGMFDSRNNLKMNKKLLGQIILIIALGFIVVLGISGTSLFNSISVGLQGFRGGEGTTLDYRFRIWAATLSTLQSKADWIFGKPFGTGYVMDMGTYTRSITPHNGYVHALLRMGYIGLVIIAGNVLSCFYVCIKKKNRVAACTCIMILVMWIAYTFETTCAVALAITMHSVLRANTTLEERK